ncbi:hypothetical protein F5Y11DRAFT_328502 [Daldinia sp. FL1419]|nr:hypothetical protein F5Y11DRAFT_328502 [Daldinia sp. FL1419]
MAQIDEVVTEVATTPSTTLAPNVAPTSPKDEPSESPIKTSQSITIEIPPSSVADDDAFVAALVEVINAAYTETETGIFKPGYLRTSAKEVSALIRSGVLAVASRPISSDRHIPLGCISIRKLDENRTELGLFAVAVEVRGTALGRDLLSFAEQKCLSELGSPGVAVVRLDILFPTHFKHLFKMRLQKWYTGLGYQMVGRRDFSPGDPETAQLLTGPTEFRILEKKLVWKTNTKVLDLK